MDTIRKLAWAYSAMFIFVVALGYIPGFTDNQGQMFGLFVIDPIDDALHLFSGIWAAFAAWRSTRASIFYFRAFGILYFLDGVLGLLTGQGYLDAGILFHGITHLHPVSNLAANLPHLLIGGIAIWIGFGLSRQYELARE